MLRARPRGPCPKRASGPHIGSSQPGADSSLYLLQLEHALLRRSLHLDLSLLSPPTPYWEEEKNKLSTRRTGSGKCANAARVASRISSKQIAFDNSSP